uniref:Uncharacterized protein n=1 Tax=Solanum lycopersicum TaxID=4081 RepID=A0A3Q7INT6_SOLLC
MWGLKGLFDYCDVCWLQQEAPFLCLERIPFHEPQKVVVLREDTVSALDLTAVEIFFVLGVGWRLWCVVQIARLV